MNRLRYDRRAPWNPKCLVEIKGEFYGITREKRAAARIFVLPFLRLAIVIRDMYKACVSQTCGFMNRNADYVLTPCRTNREGYENYRCRCLGDTLRFGGTFAPKIFKSTRSPFTRRSATSLQWQKKISLPLARRREKGGGYVRKGLRTSLINFPKSPVERMEVNRPVARRWQCQRFISPRADENYDAFASLALLVVARTSARILTITRTYRGNTFNSASRSPVVEKKKKKFGERFHD